MYKQILAICFKNNKQDMGNKQEYTKLDIPPRVYVSVLFSDGRRVVTQTVTCDQRWRWSDRDV